MIDFENRTDLKIDLKKAETILNYILSISDKTLSNNLELIIVNNSEIKEINKEYRGIDKPTDVLSFPMDILIPEAFIGTIIISSDKVIEGAKEFKHSIEDEFLLLFIHGVLHLIGYDHEIDNGEMREQERRVIENFNLPDSLIVRSDK